MGVQVAKKTGRGIDLHAFASIEMCGDLYTKSYTALYAILHTDLYTRRYTVLYGPRKSRRRTSRKASTVCSRGPRLPAITRKPRVVCEIGGVPARAAPESAHVLGNGRPTSQIGRSQDPRRALATHERTGEITRRRRRRTSYDHAPL